METMVPPVRLYDGYTYWVVRMARLMRQTMADRLTVHDLNERILGLLMSVGGSNLTTPSAIANYMAVDRAIVARTLREMQARDLVELQANIHDGRSREIVLTAQGRALLDIGIQCAHENNMYFSSLMPGGMAGDIRLHYRSIVEAQQDTPKGQPLLKR